MKYSNDKCRSCGYLRREHDSDGRCYWNGDWQCSGFQEPVTETAWPDSYGNMSFPDLQDLIKIMVEKIQELENYIYADND